MFVPVCGLRSRHTISVRVRVCCFVSLLLLTQSSKALAAPLCGVLLAKELFLC